MVGRAIERRLTSLQGRAHGNIELENGLPGTAGAALPPLFIKPLKTCPIPLKDQQARPMGRDCPLQTSHRLPHDLSF